MDQENPTTGDSGASIAERLERYIAADDAPEQTSQQPEPQAREEGTAATESVEAVEGVQPEVEEPQISTDVLAKFLGIDASMLDVGEDGQPVFKTKIDGREVPAKFQDFLKDYQIRGHAENKAREAAEAQKAFETKAREAEQALVQRFEQAEQLAKFAAEELLAEYRGIDWAQLDQHPDQGAVAALKMKFQERQQKILNSLGAIQQQRAQLQQKSAAEAQAAQQAIVARETERLHTYIPEWKDPVARAKDDAEMTTWALNSGFSKEELGTFVMAHHINTVRKAMLYDKLQSAKPEVENKVRTAPKLVKPGQAAPKGPAAELQSLRSEVRKTGGKGDSFAQYLLKSGLASTKT